MARYNQNLYEIYSKKYPREVSRNYEDFDSFDEFEKYCESAVSRVYANHPDLYIRLANEAEFEQVSDWLLSQRKSQKNDNIDYVVGIERATGDFFVIESICCHEDEQFYD